MFFAFFSFAFLICGVLGILLVSAHFPFSGCSLRSSHSPSSSAVCWASCWFLHISPFQDVLCVLLIRLPHLRCAGHLAGFCTFPLFRMFFAFFSFAFLICGVLGILLVSAFRSDCDTTGSQRSRWTCCCQCQHGRIRETGR